MTAAAFPAGRAGARSQLLFEFDIGRFQYLRPFLHLVRYQAPEFVVRGIRRFESENGELFLDVRHGHDLQDRFVESVDGGFPTWLTTIVLELIRTL